MYGCTAKRCQATKSRSYCSGAPQRVSCQFGESTRQCQLVSELCMDNVCEVLDDLPAESCGTGCNEDRCACQSATDCEDSDPCTINSCADGQCFTTQVESCQ